MKSKVFLVYFTRIYGLVKLVQFAIYFKSVMEVIIDDDCESDCVAEYSEAVLIFVLFLPIILFIYGSLRVKLMTEFVVT